MYIRWLPIETNANIHVTEYGIADGLKRASIENALLITFLCGFLAQLYLLYLFSVCFTCLSPLRVLLCTLIITR